MEHLKVCVWQEDQDGNWDTQCGGCFIIEEGTPSENDMKYCCYCGDWLVEKRTPTREYTRQTMRMMKMYYARRCRQKCRG